MKDTDCVDFLQWALPRLHMRWPGFRKVRKRVCKRLARRIAELGLSDSDAYRRHLAGHPREWQLLDELCRVVVTRFYRDRLVFATLAERILPALADAATAAGETTLRCWSVGSASGEEPYTLAIIWRQLLQPRYPDLDIAILATEVDSRLLARSSKACYPAGTVRNLPEELRDAAFTRSDDQYCLRPSFRSPVSFRRQDIRTAMPEERFHMILCRNLVFTYYDQALQQRLFDRLLQKLQPNGWLVVGVREKLPFRHPQLTPVSERLGLYRLNADKTRSMP
jgi:chemotaxis protein methyltransferase CheR